MKLFERILLGVGVLAASVVPVGAQITPAKADSMLKAEEGIRVPEMELLDLILTTRDSVDHRYVQMYRRVFSPRLYYGGKIVTFGFTPSKNYTDNVQYYPNVRTNFGIGAFYGIFGLSFSYNLSSESADRVKKYGKTEFFDGAFNSYQVSYGYDLFYQSYRGFFLAKPQNIVSPTIPTAGETSFPQRGDIVLRNGGANFYKIYNYQKFSMQAAFPQVRRQLRSAGSWLHMMGASYMTIRGDSAVSTPLADGLLGQSTAARSFDRGRFLTLTLSPGYGHTFVVHHFYVSGVLFVGPGLQLQNLQNGGTEDLYLSPFIRTNLRAAVGFNSARFFTSVQLMYDRARNYVEGVRLQATNNGYSVQLGYRF